MKTLANCTPREFLKQTNKIRKSVEKWLTITQILEVRKRKPDIPKGATLAEQRAALSEQMRKNLFEMLDRALDKYPDETAELLGLLCFIEPEDLDNHSMAELLGNIAELLGSEEVINFFISLAKLGNTNISGTATE